MRNAWRDLLGRLSGPHISFSFRDVARWKPTDFQAFCDLELLIETAHSSADILCPECSAHFGRADLTEDGLGAVMFCEREGRSVDVDPQHLTQWEPNKVRFIALLAASLGIMDRVLPLLAGQLWRLGRSTVARRQRDIFVAAVAPDDITVVVREIRRGYGTVAGVLFLPTSAPDPGERAKLKTVDLSHATSFNEGKITVDLAFIEEQFMEDRLASSQGAWLKGPARILKAHRMGILKAHAPDGNLTALAGRLGVSPSALYGMVRDDRSRYSRDKLEQVLSKIGCSRAKWDRAPKPASRA